MQETSEALLATSSPEDSAKPSENGGRAKIVVQNVYKVFGKRVPTAIAMIRDGKDKAEIHAETGCTVGVKDASFTINEGEIFVVMGLSGSGKSTVLRLLNRLIEPTLGSILIDGEDVTKMGRRELIELRRRDMSMVFQSFALLPNRTVLDNCAFGLEVAGVGLEERQAKAMKALEAVGLAAYAASRPDELSGGMRQRVGLARALASEPTILLMDEAFSALDPLIRTEMQDELLRLQAENSRTIVFVSHDLDEAMRIGDRIAIMQHGDVVQVGTPEEIVMNPANDYVRSFFRNVDVSQVFTAGDIARQTQVTVIERPGSNIHAALDRMQRHDRDLAIVVSRNRQYQGMVTTESLAEAVRSKAQDPFHKAYLPDIAPIAASAPLTDIVSVVAESRWPVPVTNDNGRYVGAISKSSLLLTLDRGN